MNQLQDIVVLLIFVPIQWRITVLWRRLVRARAGRTGDRLLLAINGLNLVLLAGWLLAIIPSFDGPLVTGLPTLLLRTFVLTYCMSATGGLFLHTVFRALKKLMGEPKFSPGRRRALNMAGNLAMATPFVALSYGALVGRLDFHVREIDVPLAGLPDDLDALRLLHISDIHLSAFLSEAELARVIDEANGLRAHLALFTGDLISSHGDPVDAGIRQLARLKTDAGIFGCMGNHERFAKLEDYTAAAGARAGIPFLRSQTHSLRFGKANLNLAGVDYQPMFKKESYLRGADKLLVPGEFNLLMSHNPDVFPVAAR